MGTEFTGSRIVFRIYATSLHDVGPRCTSSDVTKCLLLHAKIEQSPMRASEATYPDAGTDLRVDDVNHASAISVSWHSEISVAPVELYRSGWELAKRTTLHC